MAEFDVGRLRRDRRGATRPRGFTYLWLLLLVAIGSVSLVALGQLWHTTGQRERERELIFRGEQIARGLAAFHAASGVGPPRWPRTLDEVVQDKRGPVDRHHLRQRYADPMAPDGQWALITDGQGGITGVHSTSQALAFIHREEDEAAGPLPETAAPSSSLSSSSSSPDTATASRGKTVAQHLFLAEAVLAAAPAASAAVAPQATEPSRPSWAKEPDQRSDKPASTLFQ